MAKKILIIDDESNIRTTLKGSLEDEGFQVIASRSGALGLHRMRSFRPDVVLLDIWMPDEDGIQVLEKIKKNFPLVEVIMMSGHGTVETAVKAIKLGAFDYLEKPLHFDKLLVLLKHVFDLEKLKRENQYLRQELGHEESLIGASPPMIKLKGLIAAAAPSNGWVLIQGENGTGKELVARALHLGSLRSSERFVAVNCAAIPDELIESELFGHEKGSFTGAHDRKIGKFELASGGTLFLDEVGDMGAKMQAKILRALQEDHIQRVGGSETIDIDVRVIAATNKDLPRLIQDGKFRQDLYYRLNVIPIHVPRLRDRREDIALLVKHFLRRFSGGRRKQLPPKELKKLVDYSWPGNVRELKNWVERACILSQTDVVDSWSFEAPVFLGGELPSTEPTTPEGLNLREARADFEKRFIQKVLSNTGGNVSKTAQIIGLERSHLHKKMKSYGIEVNPLS